MELKLKELESLLANYMEKDKNRLEIQSESISIALKEQREAFYQENARQKELLLEQQKLANREAMMHSDTIFRQHAVDLEGKDAIIAQLRATLEVRRQPIIFSTRRFTKVTPTIIAYSVQVL